MGWENRLILMEVIIELNCEEVFNCIRGVLCVDRYRYVCIFVYVMWIYGIF